ncbi:MmcQ/YjbR family DNA-binding protein [Paludibaculum fermentans]|uniref:MmcQ/YjbR family DNA-binding protein n=1 Tax=Paludibaculum fermentans TaxID=1473598 RepID=A0A7S7SMN6_PALFE|nr:MmcQ/YjbR family DNA-binding protein [Paludibaculum fermentans]QOY90624.1 MmcQ/YjbR family DNA-binding protein [Paludibaculum fermentans]
MPKSAKPVDSEAHLQRVRRICLSLPGTMEKLSHGEPTFFVNRKVFTMFSNNHHNDGHIAVWIPVPPGAQATMLATWPETFYYPPYVGVSGWVGVELDRISDDDLASHILEAWRLRAPAKLLKPKL